jgi:hypothetical protein
MFENLGGPQLLEGPQQLLDCHCDTVIPNSVVFRITVYHTKCNFQYSIDIRPIDTVSLYYSDALAA